MTFPRGSEERRLLLEVGDDVGGPSTHPASGGKNVGDTADFMKTGLCTAIPYTKWRMTPKRPACALCAISLTRCMHNGGVSYVYPWSIYTATMGPIQYTEMLKTLFYHMFASAFVCQVTETTHTCIKFCTLSARAPSYPPMAVASRIVHLGSLEPKNSHELGQKSLAPAINSVNRC